MVRGLRPSSPASSPIRIALASIACTRPGVTEPRSVLPRAPARSRGRIEADPGQDLAEPGVADAGLVIGDAHLAGAVVWLHAAHSVQPGRRGAYGVIAAPAVDLANRDRDGCHHGLLRACAVASGGGTLTVELPFEWNVKPARGDSAPEPGLTFQTDRRSILRWGRRKR